MRNHPAHLLRRSILVGSVALLGFSITRLLADESPATQPATRPAVVVSNPPATAPVAVDIDRLINQLGSDNSDDRDAAQKQLVDAGLSAMPALKKAAESSTDPEIRSRAAAAMAQLKDHVDNDVSLITLHMKDASTRDVLDAISTQAHAQITSLGAGRILGADNRMLTVDADRKPFWDVMSDVCGQLNVCPMVELSGNGQLRLMPAARNWMQAPHQIVGPFWVGVTGVYRNRSIDLQGPPAIDDQFTVHLTIVPEPKLAVAQMSDLMLTEAADNAGHSLLPKAQANAAARALLRSITLGQTTRTVESRLTYPDQPGTKIAILRGQVDVQIGEDVQQYIVDDVMGAQKVTNPLKNCAIAVAVARQGTAGMYRVTIDCTREGLSDDQWAAMVNRMNDVTLEDAEGHQLTALTHMMPVPTSDTTFKSSLFFSNNGGFGVAMIRVAGVAPAAVAPAVKVGDPKKLVWNVATALKTMKVPVVFKDLPMP